MPRSALPSSELLDKIVGLKGAKSHIVFLQAPNNQLILELTKFLHPANEPAAKGTFMYSRGIKHIAFVVENIKEIVAIVKQKGWEIFVDVYTYDNIYKLCYFRGPEGIIIELRSKSNREDPQLVKRFHNYKLHD